MYKISCFADEISPRLDQQLDEMEKLNVKWMSLRSVDDINVLQLSDARVDEIAHALKERGMGILITDHNVRETLQIVDRAYILNSGKILLEGDSQTIANSPVAKKFYLGDNFTL